MFTVVEALLIDKRHYAIVLLFFSVANIAIGSYFISDSILNTGKLDYSTLHVALSVFYIAYLNYAYQARVSDAFDLTFVLCFIGFLFAMLHTPPLVLLELMGFFYSSTTQYTAYLRSALGIRWQQKRPQFFGAFLLIML